MMERAVFVGVGAGFVAAVFAWGDHTAPNVAFFGPWGDSFAPWAMAANTVVLMMTIWQVRRQSVETKEAGKLLQAQTEAMQAQAEAQRAQNDELRVQSRALTEQSEGLRLSIALARNPLTVPEPLPPRDAVEQQGLG